jgi:hypothetical protein
MVFHRSNHRDERRRRVLIEETGLSATEPSAGTAARVASGPVRSYTEAALSPHQPRVVDLIPSRCWTISVLTLLALSTATGLEALYGHLALGHSVLTVAQVPAVDLAASGNVAEWFSSVLLLAAAGLGILTSLIRRHRVDDYRGRYRMWYWVVPLLFAASLNQVSDLSTSLRTAVLVLAGVPGYPDAELIWTASLTVVAAVVGIRLALEMRACRLSVVSLAVALASYVAVGAIELNWMLAGEGPFRVMAVGGLRLAANISLFLAMCLYARHVFRDASGLVTPKAGRATPKAKPRRKRDESISQSTKPSESAAADSSRRPADSKVRIDAPHATSPSAGIKVQKPKPAESAPDNSNRRPPTPSVGEKPVADSADDEFDTDDDAGGDKLSKAERRRLRKLQRRER